MMLRLAVFALGRRGYFSHYSKVLTPLLVKSTSLASFTSLQPLRKTQLLPGTSWRISSAPISSNPSEKITLNPHQKESVLEQLKLFDESLNIHSVVWLLGWLGRTVYRKVSERDHLEKESADEETSVFIRMLNCVADNISRLQPRELAVVIWSLGRIKEGHHSLITVCEKEILSRGIDTFDYRSVGQIAYGFSLLRMGETSVFKEIENAILCGQLDLATFDLHGLAQTMLSFVITANGSVELFQVFSENIRSREFSTFKNNDLAQFAWSFAKKEFEADQLFEKIESELFRRGVSEIVMGADISMLLWAFATAKQGSDALFKAFEKQVLRLKSLRSFKDGDISQTIWALGKVGVKSEAIYERLEGEVERRGIEGFSTNNRKMVLEGLKYAERENETFMSS